MEQNVSWNSFQKIQSTSQGLPYFWKFGNSRNFPFHLSFLPGMILALVPQLVNFARPKLHVQDAGEYTKWSAIVWPVLDCLSSPKKLRSDFLGNCGLVVPNSLWVSSPGLHTLPREKFVSFSHKGRVEFWVRVNLLPMKQLNTAFETATFIMILQYFL